MKLNLLTNAPAGQQVMFDHDPLYPELDNPLPPARDDTKQDEPATAKQRQYIAALMDDLGWHSEQIAVYAHEQGIDLVNMTKTQASTFIDGLKRLAHPARPTTAALTATACAVCQRGRVATMAPARLCPACLGDLEITRAHVEGVLTSAMANVERQADAWQQALCAVDEATLARFRRAERLLETGAARTTKGFVETWHNETEARTPLGVVLLAYEAYQTALQALKEQRDWAVRAMREIEVAER